MKLYNSMGPNPKVVCMFMAEAGVDLEKVEVDIMSGENRGDEYVAKNPGGQLPCLELDDGTFIAEITAICEYLDDKNGNSSLIGTTPEERAETRMWVRRIDLAICENLANGFRYAEGQQLFESRMRLIPQAADDLKTLTQEKVTWLDGLMEGKQFVCGDRFTLADVLLYGFLEFGAQVGQPLNQDNKNIVAWYERVGGRPSASA